VSPKSGQISIKIFRYIVLLPEVIVGRESLMFLVNNHILKMAAM